jgi:hypothetical protein
MLEASAVVEADIPPELRPEWEWIVHETTKKGPAIGRDGTVYQGAVQNTMFRIRKATGVKIAKRIWNFYWEMCRIADAE